ncbi:hypothetical protein [Alicyclobacillus ferrooxydans]|uniref:Uncharacterized protein n=1 Tax=Alicyclobacillus ferrooxydans TaxID=471514 RepID=A0A0P9CEQ8_9BACL|nr:hypothetical protein [Alicyclobacillus ferrooxydans]KPV44103.1 hypothetical protein AN477_08480 [Alicyclobacillus ferrooxydans]
MDIREVAKVKEQSTEGKVIVEFQGIATEKLQDLVTECSSGTCSCGGEEFLSSVDSFVLAEDGKTIEISGKLKAEEVVKTLQDWEKEL